MVIIDRILWNAGGPKTEKRALLWYIYGSKKEGCMGIGVKGPNCRAAQSLGTFPPVFQAEAIEVHALENLKKGLKGVQIYIMYDSQVALTALNRFSFNLN